MVVVRGADAAWVKLRSCQNMPRSVVTEGLHTDGMFRPSMRHAKRTTARHNICVFRYSLDSVLRILHGGYSPILSSINLASHQQYVNALVV